ncbi:MAG: FAD-binding oxidoreductase, partial [Desulfobulbaceae bacterium]|nr:FAD-binding oxidoreductase [Desulfobulbaceae bacterium]
YLPSACGGKGTCAYCKVKVLSGGGSLLPTETPYLSPAEIAAGIRISCQVKVKEDLEIEVPLELLAVKEYRVQVETIVDVTPDIKHLRFAILSPPEGITFRAGQYVQLEAPLAGSSGSPEFRAYSIASSPEERHHIELIVTKVPEGTVSVYVHDRLQKGDELIMRGPFGDFYLRDSPRETLLIATGSGLAPIRSMLYERAKKNDSRSFTFFFGDRRPVDLLFHDEMSSFEKRLDNFRFIPVLSRATLEDQWPGAKGRVTDLIRNQVAEGAEVDVFICGAPSMVQSCCDILIKEKKIPPERIHYDKFE